MVPLKIECPQEDWILAVRAAGSAPKEIGIRNGAVIGFEGHPHYFYVYRTPKMIVVRRSRSA